MKTWRIVIAAVIAFLIVLIACWLSGFNFERGPEAAKWFIFGVVCAFFSAVFAWEIGR